MTNRAKAKGTAWETRLVDALVPILPDVERRTLAGANDKGDIAGVRLGRHRVCVEAKAEATFKIGPWLAETAAETVNSRSRWGVCWFKRPGRTTAADGYVVMTGGTFLEILDALKET